MLAEIPRSRRGDPGVSPASRAMRGVSASGPVWSYASSGMA
jgi:hypothetical protein